MSKWLLTIAALFFLLNSIASAQSAIDGFDPNANGTVWAVVVQPDGKVLIGGEFTTISPNGGAPVARNRIARLNADGTLDTAFNPNANNTVFAIALQADGSVLAGGSFTTIGGQPRNRMARLDATSGLADSFDPNASGLVQSIVIQADGKILAGGQFTGIGSQTRHYIARLDAASGLADSFNPDASDFVHVIALQGDGKVLAGGLFTEIGGQSRNCIGRLDAVTGLADSFDPHASSVVEAIAVQADGKVLAGGQFSGPNSIGGQTRTGIARLDPVTGLADSWNPNSNSQVRSIVVQPDGRILVGGAFNGANSIGGQPRNYLARLDTTTALADSFNPTANLNVMSMAAQGDGKVIAAGFFTTVAANGAPTVTRNRIARFESSGTLDQTLDLGIVGTQVNTIAVQPDGKILIAGIFSTVLGVTRNNIARLNRDGTLDMAFDPNANGNIYSVAQQTDGKILVGGVFTNIGGQPRNGIARLDAISGAVDLTWNPNAGGNSNEVDSIVVQTDGMILVGGNFTVIGGTTRRFIARLDATTGLADSWNPDSISQVLTIALQADGKILVGGDFFGNIGGQPRNKIARLDPVSGLADSFSPNTDAGHVYVLVVQPDGKILVGGTFGNIGGQPRGSVARLDPVTGLADSFNPNTDVSQLGGIYTMAVQADGKVLIGGAFTMVSGQPRNRIARVDAITGVPDSFDPNLIPGPFVFSAVVQADGKVLVGGSFGNMGGQTRNFFARLTNDTAALQNVAVTPTTVTWTRGGSSPQFGRVTFESSTDNVNFTPLGNGTASGSNWTLTGLSLPTNQNFYIRARGYYRASFITGSENIQETVQNGFFAPATITSANNTTFTAGTAGSFTVSTTGIPGGASVAISKSGALPSGVTFVDNNDGTATIAGTAAAGAGGSYPMTITATNGVSPNGSQSFTLTVNEAPRISSGDHVPFMIGAFNSFTVKTDRGFPTPALSKSGSLPSGVAFTDNGNGTATIAGTPAGGSGGTYPLTITANNGTAPNATQSFTLNVNSPSASSATIKGRIVDNHGLPLAGAVVRLEGTEDRKFITDANGFYRFDNVETGGFYTVTPSRVNYGFTPSSRSFSQIGESTEATFGATATGQNTNPLDTPEYFVRQHYLDFLGREPDEAGFNFWSDQILECGNDNQCVARRRENVSAAYFLSIEFQQTGGLVDRLYQASYGVDPEFSQFMPDMRAVGNGVVVGRAGWQDLLTTNKRVFVEAFANRPTFRAAYDGLSNSDYVDALISHTGASFTTAERDELASGLADGSMTRAVVLERVAGNDQFVNAKFNEVFVLMEYFGYLRRDPDSSGFTFWLNKLNEFNGNFERAEMVKAFVISGEYRNRFPN
ncbi:MAG TPA: DUF4214 domain-containing protein [Pyrinomonadaceae bacterium]|nr:DUF4214 domain-containing protein [Pyrinomonadaceae bacterium]